MRRSPRSLIRFVAAAAVFMMAASCTGTSGPGPSPGPPGSIKELTSGGKLSVLPAQSALVTGSNDFAFGLITAKGGLVQGGAPEVWAAKTATSKAIGPFTATSFQFSAYKHLNDQSPITPLTSFYVATVQIAAPGRWVVAAVVKGV